MPRAVNVIQHGLHIVNFWTLPEWQTFLSDEATFSFKVFKNMARRLKCALLQHSSQRTLLRVGRDGGAHAVGADALNGSGHRKLLQAAFEVAMLSLQLLLHV